MVAGVVWTEVNGVLLGHSDGTPFVIRQWALSLPRLGSGARRWRTKLLIGTKMVETRIERWALWLLFGKEKKRVDRFRYSSISIHRAEEGIQEFRRSEIQS